jgi:hypothetical protein
MKKLILLLILISFMPFANAEINLLSNIENFYNINEKIPLKLSISSNEERDGFVKASLICDKNNIDYFMSPFAFTTSQKEIEIPELRLTKNMLGKCSLESSLLDNSNILIEKKIIKLFEVSENLNLNFDLNKDKLLPNEELKITGEVKNIRGESLNTGKVKIYFDNQESQTDLDKGKFSYSYRIPGNIKSNTHSLKLSFDDNNGNKVAKESSISVIPKPSSLKIKINKLDFLPKEQVLIESLLYDQADDLIENDAKIKVYDTKNNLIREGNNNLDFTLDQYALPGTWVIKASTDDFNIESKFNIGEIKKVETYLEDGTVYIKNIGNAPFNQEIKIEAIGENGKEFYKKVELNPKESKAIPLSSEIKEGGKFNINVLANNEKQSYQSVNIPESNNPLYLTGRVVSNTGNMVVDKPFIPLTIIIALALLIFARKSRKRNIEYKRQRDSQEGYNIAKKIEQEKMKMGIKPRRFKIDEAEAKDFTNRMLKNAEDNKKNNQGYLYRNPPKEKGGLFGMFD